MAVYTYIGLLYYNNKICNKIRIKIGILLTVTIYMQQTHTKSEQLKCYIRKNINYIILLFTLKLDI